MDVVAVGLVSGHIIVHNIKFDETLMKFQQDWGPITAISFRTGKSFENTYKITKTKWKLGKCFEKAFVNQSLG